MKRAVILSDDLVVVFMTNETKYPMCAGNNSVTMTCYFLYTQQKCNGAPVCDKLDAYEQLIISLNRFSICFNTAYGGNDGGKVLSQYYLYCQPEELLL